MTSSLARRLQLHLMPLRALAYSVALSLAILGLGGLGFWVLDPQVRSIGDGLWLAFTTAATVGYGDMVPSTPASRVFAVLVVLVGLAVLSLVTASVAAMFVQGEERHMEHELMRELRALRHELNQLQAQVGRLEPPSPAAPSSAQPAP